MSYHEYTDYNMDPLGRVRFYGTYRATVKNNSDYENKKRISLIVPQVSGSDTIDLVDPAVSSGSIDSVTVPEIGETVWVIFESGDPSYPLWMSGAGFATQGYYGAFSDYTNQYAGGATTLVAAAANTAAPMKLGQTDENNGVSIQSGSRITFSHAGTYNIQWSAEFVNEDTSINDVSVWFRKNGVNVVGSRGEVAITNTHGGTHGHVLPSWNFVFTTAANSYYEFVWSTPSPQVYIATFGTANSPTRPSTASVVVTVTPVSNTQVGPTGPAGSVQVGTTTTNLGGTPAVVTNSGNSTNAILNFNIPSGVAISNTAPSSTQVLWADTGTTALLNLTTLTVSGAITAGSLSATGAISATGTITGGTFSGSGALLTSIPSTAMVSINGGGA